MATGCTTNSKGAKGLISESEQSTSNNEISVEKTFSADSLNDVSIKTTNAYIKLIPSDTKDIKVQYYGQKEKSMLKSTPQFSAVITGDKLVISEKQKIDLSVDLVSNEKSIKLYVCLPKSYSGNLEINTSSSNASINEFNFKSFKFDSYSGNLEASSLNTKTAEIKTSSGKVNIKDLSGKLTVKSVDGNITISDTDLTEGMNIQSDSGTITISCSNLNGDIKTVTSYGNVKIGLPENAGANIEFRSNSGDFNTDFTTSSNKKDGKVLKTTIGDGKHLIQCSTDSGKLKILKRTNG
jgi:DUF4097 and DUF4098 domain-containing protein YvlB